MHKSTLRAHKPIHYADSLCFMCSRSGSQPSDLENVGRRPSLQSAQSDSNLRTGTLSETCSLHIHMSVNTNLEYLLGAEQIFLGTHVGVFIPVLNVLAPCCNTFILNCIINIINIITYNGVFILCWHRGIGNVAYPLDILYYKIYLYIMYSYSWTPRPATIVDI